MAVSYGKGDRGKATRIHSNITRAVAGSCQHCGKTKEDGIQLQTAHIISRQYANTRTELDNAFCLCAACHRYFTNLPVAFGRFVYANLGEKRYNELEALALSGAKVNWKKRVEELQAVAEELGLDALGNRRTDEQT